MVPTALEAIDRLHRRYATYSAFPGRPLRFLENLRRDGDRKVPATASDVLAAFTRETGLPRVLLDPNVPLDVGQTRDWFNSNVIVAGTIIAIFASAAFFLRGWNKTDNIIDLSLLRDRNFIAGTLAITAYGISLFGWMAIMPLFSQRLLGYPPDVAGTLFIPRGIVSAITLAITGSILIRLFDALRHLPKPTVAGINGHCYAGGSILALACDERIMAEGDFQFALNEVTLGVVHVSRASSTRRPRESGPPG